MRYVSDEGGLVTTLINGNVDLQIGQQNVVYCFNGDTVNLTKGQVVAIVGNQGNRPKIIRAIASAETTSSTSLGVVAETINIGNEGFVTTFGNVRGFSITGITPGSYVYLSPTTKGGFTGTQPQAPDHIVALGYVVRTGNTQGEIFVNINNGWELNELHNVRITNPTNNDILQYSAGTFPVWVNTSRPILDGLTANTISATTYQNLPISGLTEGLNISITGSNGNFTVSFTGTTGTNFTGGTVSGATIFTNGLTANTISATTYSGDGSGLTNVQNIYNSDGTISSDRYVNISANTLWFSGLTKGFQVRISDENPKSGFIVTSDSLGGPSFSAFENGNVLIEGPTEFLNTSQFSSTVSMINLSPDITSPYLLGLNNSSEVTTFDSGLLLNSITGGTYSGTTLYLNNNTGGTIQITGFTSGSGTVSGNGTANFLPKWTGSTGLGNSQIRDDGTTIGINSSPISGAFVDINDTTTASTSSVNIINNSINKTSVSATGGNVGYFSLAFGTALTKSFEGYATNGTNAYGFYGVVSPDEFYTITNGIGGYFEVSINY